jgi:hypothetical protein
LLSVEKTLLFSSFSVSGGTCWLLLKGIMKVRPRQQPQMEFANFPSISESLITATSEHTAYACGVFLAAHASNFLNVCGCNIFHRATLLVKWQ